MIAICLPFNRKTIHQPRNTAFSTQCHGPMGLKQRLSNQCPSLRKVYPKPVVLNWGHFCPTRGTSGDVWRHLAVTTGGCSWWPVCRGQGLFNILQRTGCRRRQRTVWLKVSGVRRTGKPCSSPTQKGHFQVPRVFEAQETQRFLDLLSPSPPPVPTSVLRQLGAQGLSRYKASSFIYCFLLKEMTNQCLHPINIY